MEYFLIVRYKISIYSLHTHELFLNIFIWDNKTIFNVSHFFLYNLCLYALFLNFLIRDIYICLHPHKLFLKFLMCDKSTTLHISCL